MKKLLQLSFLLTLLPLVSKSQITIGTSDISPYGYLAVQSRDSFPDASIVPGGTGAQTWNFSTLKDMAQDTLIALTPSATPYASEYPDASFTIRRDTALYLYFKNSDDALRLLGISGKLYYQTYLVEGSLNITPTQSVLRFPTELNSTYTESTVSTVQVPGSVIGSTFDSLRLRTFTSREVVFDAFGELTTPAGTYETLRAKEAQISFDSVYVFSSGFWFPLQGTSLDTIIYYNWWTNQDGLGFPAVQMESRTNGEIRTISWLKEAVTSTKETGNFMPFQLFPNPATSHLMIETTESFDGSLEVYDMNGRLVLTNKIQSQREVVNTQRLLPGAHVLVLKDRNGRLKGFKRFLVVERE